MWRPLRLLTGLAVLVSGTSLPIAAGAPAAHAIEGTGAQYTYSNSIREKVWVQSSVDGDADGKSDMIAVDIIRPADSSKKAITNVPVIMDASPYYYNVGRGNQSQNKRDVDLDGVIDKFPLYYDNYFVPRGYAVAFVDSAGTGQSEGCPDIGGPVERAAVKAAIDWLGGRTGGYYDKAKTQPVQAGSWSSGKVGMIGKSWDATLANAMLTYGTDPLKGGLPNLKTVVPIAGISSWYDYYFSNGVSLRNGEAPSALASFVANSAAKSKCGNAWKAMDSAAGFGTDSYGIENSFWQSRNYQAMLWNSAIPSGTAPGVFMVHGLNDTNVKTNQFGELWDVARARQMPHKLWLSQLGHTDPFDYDRNGWVNTLHQWFDYWLQGINNGIMADAAKPQVELNQADNWATYSNDWSLTNPGKADTVQYLQGPPTSISSLSNGETEDNMVAGHNSLRFNLASTPTRLAGRPQVKIRAGLNTTGTHMTAMLVDRVTTGTFNRVDPFAKDTNPICDNGSIPCWPDETSQTLSTVSDVCNQAGESSQDSCVYHDVKRITKNSSYQVISRGWFDTRYNPVTNTKGNNTPGVMADYFVDLTPVDYVLEPGHTLELVIGGSDRTLTQPGTDTTLISINPSQSYCELKEAYQA